MQDISRLLEMDWKNGVLFLAAIIVVAVFVIQKFDWIVERFGLQSKRQIKEAKQDKDINELKDRAKKTDENIEKIYASISGLKDSIDEVSAKVSDLQRKTNDAERNKLRDRIGQGYRYYRQKGQWNHIEKEAFEGLIESYEAAGGTNGFVHTKVIPESLTWEVVDE